MMIHPSGVVRFRLAKLHRAQVINCRSHKVLQIRKKPKDGLIMRREDSIILLSSGPLNLTVNSFKPPTIFTSNFFVILS